MDTTVSPEIVAYAENLSESQMAKVSALAHRRARSLGWIQCRTGGAVWQRALFEVLENLVHAGIDVDEIELEESEPQTVDELDDFRTPMDDHDYGYVRQWHEPEREKWKPLYEFQPAYLFAMPREPATLEQFQLFAMLCDYGHDLGWDTDVLPNNVSRDEAQRIINEWGEKITDSTLMAAR